VSGSSLKPNPYGPNSDHRSTSTAPPAHSAQAPASGPPPGPPLHAANGASKPVGLSQYSSDPATKQGNAPTALPPSNLPRTTSAPSSTPPRSSAQDRTIPGITSILGPSGAGAPQRTDNGNRTPPGGPLPGIAMLREIPDPLSGPGRERDKSDLKRLDSHSLKFN